MRDRVLSPPYARTASPGHSAAHAPGRSAEAPRRRSHQLPAHVWGTEPPPPVRRAPRMRPSSPRSPQPRPPRPSSSPRCSPCRTRRPRTSWTPRRPRRVRSPTFCQLPTRGRPPTGTRGASGIGVIASASEGRAVVTLSGYGELPSDRVHQLWLMRPDVRPRSLGLFKGDTPLVATGLDKTATSLAVTVEPNGGSEQPTSAASCPTRPGIGWIRRVVVGESSTPLWGR